MMFEQSVKKNASLFLMGSVAFAIHTKTRAIGSEVSVILVMLRLATIKVLKITHQQIKEQTNKKHNDTVLLALRTLTLEKLTGNHFSDSSHE